MNKYYNPYERIQLYISWFSNNEYIRLTDDFSFGVSMNFLCNISKIPIDIIRKDICSIFMWQSKLLKNEIILENSENLNIAINLSFPEKYLNEESETYIEDLETYYNELITGTFSSDFKNYILLKQMDNIPLCLNKNTYNENRFKLWVSPNEYEALKEYQVLEKISIDYDKSFLIKDSYRFNHEYVNLSEKLFTISDAIKNNSSIKIIYSKSENINNEFIIKPIKIIYDTLENQYTLLSTTGKDIFNYRLEYITSVSLSSTKINSTKIEAKIKEIEPIVWGNSFTNKPIGPVKVKFYNEGNVWNKVKKDFENRDPSLLYEENGFLYFETPKLYGGHNGANFLRWIRSFGSSAIVISPIELRNQLIESYKRRLL